MKLFTAAAVLLFLAQISGPRPTYAETLAPDSSMVNSVMGKVTPIQMSFCSRSCLEACGSNKGCRPSCSQDRCSTPFGCRQVFFTSFGGYLVATKGVRSFSSTDDYLLDASRYSIVAVQDRLKEVNADLAKMKKDPKTRAEYFNQLFSRGCPVKNHADAFLAYQKYKQKLDQWAKALKSPAKSKKKMLMSNVSGIKKQKDPVEVDRDFIDSLIFSFETCGLSNGVMEDYVKAVSYVK